MFAILTGLDRVIIKRPDRSQSHRMRPGAARHLSGVGTSRSALLLTVRVESGIARTKSNNGPRSWLCSLFLFCAPDTLLLQDTKLHHVRAHTHKHTHSFTRIRVTTHCCLGGRGRSFGSRRRRREALTGMAVSGEPEAVSARTSIASSCVDALLGARPSLAALVHI